LVFGDYRNDANTVLLPENSKDQYIFKLETDLKLMKSQIITQAQIKTDLEIKAERLENELKSVSQKVNREVEQKYKAELKECHFLLDSVRNEHEMLLQKTLSNEKYRPSTSPYRAKKSIKVTSPPGGRDKNKGTEDLVSTLKKRITELDTDKFKLNEQNEWLSFQLKNSSMKKEHSTSVYGDVNTGFGPNEERRMKTLGEAVFYWKDIAFKLAHQFQSKFIDMRQTNEDLKNALLAQNNQFREEVYGIVKKIRMHYKKDNLKILEVIEELEEKHNLNQSKLAEMRTKYRSLAITEKLEKTVMIPIKKKRCHSRKKSN